MTKEERKIIKEKHENDGLLYQRGNNVKGYEIWLDEETGKKYNIPIQITRYFNEIKEEEDNE
tara:strand:- start:192 stop:377 length:186 start_codon:yes stop_codon:yes gene_type:complete